jgi:CheY-like chemotaxis protein
LATDNVDGSLRLSISCTGVAAIDVAENLEINLASSIATSVGGMVKVENADGMVTADIILPTWHEPEAVPTADAPPRTLLLIESRDSVRTQLHNFFENAGYNMMEAADTEEALALLELHAHSPETGPVEAMPGDEIDLVIGDSASTRRIDQVPVLLTDQPAAHALSQSELLERVRSRLAHNLTFSASAK